MPPEVDESARTPDAQVELPLRPMAVLPIEERRARTKARYPLLTEADLDRLVGRAR